MIHMPSTLPDPVRQPARPKSNPAQAFLRSRSNCNLDWTPPGRCVFP